MPVEVERQVVSPDLSAHGSGLWSRFPLTPGEDWQGIHHMPGATMRMTDRAGRARDVLVRIGAEHERPELRSFGLVASSYGLASRKLGTVSLMGPVRMDYGGAITAVREAAHQLSRYIETVYDEA